MLRFLLSHPAARLQRGLRRIRRGVRQERAAFNKGRCQRVDVTRTQAGQRFLCIGNGGGCLRQPGARPPLKIFVNLHVAAVHQAEAATVAGQQRLKHARAHVEERGRLNRQPLCPAGKAQVDARHIGGGVERQGQAILLPPTLAIGIDHAA